MSDLIVLGVYVLLWMIVLGCLAVAVGISIGLFFDGE